jgi:hypothetical protein
MVNTEINVKTREEFKEHVRNIFIPSCNRLFGKKDTFFNFGEVMNKWTVFGIWVNDNEIVTVNLIE